MLELIYRYLGMFVFWVTIVWLEIVALFFAIDVILWALNLLHKRYKILSIIIEFAKMRKEFKEFKKQKEDASKG